ncbi:uncharacterized protein LOC144128187 isoform X2 [Amblyomma americanum]
MVDLLIIKLNCYQESRSESGGETDQFILGTSATQWAPEIKTEASPAGLSGPRRLIANSDVQLQRYAGASCA